MNTNVTPVAERFFDVLIDSGILTDDFLSNPDAIYLLLGQNFPKFCSEIVSVRCVSHRCYTRDGDFRVLSLTVVFCVSYDSELTYRVRPFIAEIISGYRFRKLRKLLKENGYI